ncbi:unnamed protein product [Hydatigera taeniaeformis]|uniref:RNase_PH domain-containing protein n=1 Tax=Hydatigena taeniaeformis TaxID=6205 RepID=A0A0R3X3R3_HYDTA|nr:unnamed protein product [Hydatigera taeniaeformis]
MIAVWREFGLPNPRLHSQHHLTHSEKCPRLTEVQHRRRFATLLPTAYFDVVYKNALLMLKLRTASRVPWSVDVAVAVAVANAVVSTVDGDAVATAAEVPPVTMNARHFVGTEAADPDGMAVAIKVDIPLIVVVRAAAKAAAVDFGDKLINR